MYSRRRFRPWLESLEIRATPATFNVSTTLDNGNSNSLRGAVVLANTTAGADSITFSAGLGPIDLTLGTLNLTDTAGVTILGPTSGTPIIRRSSATGTAHFRIFSVADGSDATFKNVTISNGLVDTGGGGGGAIELGVNCTLFLTSCTISGNSAPFGGGIDGNTSGVNLTCCTVSGNTSSIVGAGVHADGILIAYDSTIANNSSQGGGGGFHSGLGIAQFLDCTLVGNRADSAGVAIGQGGGMDVGGFVTLSNTIVSGNFHGTGSTADDFKIESGGSLDTSGSKNNLFGTGGAGGLANGTNGNIVGQPAGLSALGDHGGPVPTMVPLRIPGLGASLAIDAGSATAPVDGNDARGVPFPRQFGSGVDIGAAEFIPQVAGDPCLVDNAGDANDSNFSTGHVTLRKAVALANATPTSFSIGFAAGLGTINLTSTLSLSATVTTHIDGPTTKLQQIERSTAAGTGNFAVITLQAGASAAFSDLFIVNGKAAAGQQGGGIVLNSGSSLNMTACTVESNAADGGGGIFSAGGNAVLNGCSIDFNSATVGQGGGVAFTSGTLTATNCTFIGNSSATDGGGLALGGSANLLNCTVVSNSCDTKSVGAVGGGVFVSGGLGDDTFSNSIVAGNRRNFTSVQLDIEVAGGGTVNLTNSKNNLIGTGGSGGLVDGQNGNQVGVTNAGLSGYTNHGGLVNTLVPLAGSPAIDRGISAGVPANDGRGAPFSRQLGTAVDVGATEFTGALVVDNTGDAADSNFSAGHLTIRKALTITNATPGNDAFTFAPGLGPIDLTQGALNFTDTTGTTTVIGSSVGGQVVRRSSAAGTPQFGVCSISNAVAVVLRGVTISNGNNTSGPGGISNLGTLVMTDSVISGNTGAIGGGLYCLSAASSATLTRCTVSGNTASFGGGGITSLGPVTLTACTISGNQSSNRGAGINTGGQLTATNCTITGNTTAGVGGGIICGPGPVTLTNCTITGNRSDTGNGGLSNGGGLFVNLGTTVLKNTIIAGNFKGTGTTADDIAIGSGTLDTANSKNNLIGTGGAGGLVNGTNGNQVGIADTKLGPLADNGGPVQTFALLPNSPALNGGNPNGAPLTDARGTGRDAVPDIGAFEVQHPLSPVGVPTDFATVFSPHPSANANEAFVKGLYQATLLRAGSASEVAFYVTRLTANTLTRAQAAHDFTDSPENRGNQVKFFYKYFLNRNPSRNEVNFYIARLQGGTDEGVVMRDFILSPEFTGQNNNTEFTNTMYYATLGRGASANEINFYVNPLTAGTISRVQVLANFLHSPEGIGRVVRGDYIAYLERVPTDAEVTAATNQIAGGATFGSVAIGLLGGNEFFQDAGQNL